MKKCFYCSLEIAEGDGKIVPLDRPYVNLWVHRSECSFYVTGEYLLNHTKEVWEYAQEVWGNQFPSDKKNRKKN